MPQQQGHNKNHHGKQGSHRQGGRPGKADPGPCPADISKDTMTAISAPYNFVPLAGWVHTPEWWKDVSHDWPFEDGVSGEIHYRLIAESPLLVGGQQQKSNGKDPGEVRPFRLPDDRYAIPGSSLKGLIRAVIEIAGFGRLRMVDEQRPGLRDITGPYVAESYTNKVRNQVESGFLRLDGGKITLTPCKMLRLDHRRLESAMSVAKPIFRKRTNVAEKYSSWKKLCDKHHWRPDQIRFDRDDYQVTNLGHGSLTGYPVFTGQISDFTDDKTDKKGKETKGKYKDFVFHDERPNERFDVPDEDWRDFLAIHGDEDGKADMSWPGFWKRKFRQGEPVPVFYLQEKDENRDKLRIGLAYMPKLAGDFSTLDLIGHTSEQHRQAPGAEHGYDLADLLFGAINGDRQNDALRGRVSCEIAVAEGTPKVEQQADTILNGPKPSYFPNYLRQQTDDSSSRLKSQQYATYIETPDSKRPQVRGFKRYPTRPTSMTGVQVLTPDQRDNKKVQVRLHTLEAGSTFAGRIVFHNLKPEELGALFWALTWGGNNGLRHGLGMGKPFGFGQVRFELDHEKSQLIPNDPAHPATRLDAERLDELRQTFVTHMEAAAEQQSTTWSDSPQIANLLAMADPAAAEAVTKKVDGMELRHMRLMRCRRDGKNENLNEFQWAKQARPKSSVSDPLVLADYAVSAGCLEVSALPKAQGSDPSKGGDLHPWVTKTVDALMKKNNAKEEDTLRGKGLAQAWAAIDDPTLKAKTLASIKAAWEARGWWDTPQGGAAKKARAIYEP